MGGSTKNVTGSLGVLVNPLIKKAQSVGSSSSGGGLTLQQQQLETQQALTTANLNLEENAQRKAILNAMNGTRVFRESALSRAVAGNTVGTPLQGAPSRAQINSYNQIIVPPSGSLLDLQARGSGATPAGGAGASGGGGVTGGGTGGRTPGPFGRAGR